MLKPFPLLLAFLLLSPAPALAANGEQGLDVSNQAFHAQAERIRAELDDGTTYAEIGHEDRQIALGLLSAIGRRLDAAGSVDAMDADTRVALFNDQERINTILTGAREDSRIVCERRQVTGSHRRQSMCTTVAQRRRNTSESKSELWRLQQATPPGDSGGF